MIKFLKKRWVYHSLTWLFFFLLIYLIAFFQTEEELVFWRDFLDIIKSFIPLMLAVYANFYLKRLLFDKRKYIYYLLSVPVLMLAGGGLSSLIYQLEDSEVHNSFTQDTINLGFLLMLTMGFQYLKRGIIAQYQLQELRAKTAETELNALKAQINPHFLFNTLNNIYAINKIDAEQGGEMLLELSEVMRYHLRFSKMEKVSLEEELQLLSAYIELEKLRLTDNCDLQIDYTDVNTQLKVAPLLFLPFIENAFKHGTHPMKNCFIHLKIKTMGQEVYFEISNSIIQHKKVVKTNIGLENTKRRLEIIYPEKYELQMEEKENIYAVKLKLSV